MTKFTLRIGDSLSASIDRGLADSEFGLVILSPDFIRKPWPKRELAGLVAGEMGAGKSILPVWFNVTGEDVFRFSPPLADKKAIVFDSNADLARVALHILERVKPELHQAFQRRLAYELSRASAKLTEVAVKDISLEGPIRTDVFPQAIGNRIRIVREALLEVLPVSWRQTIDNFRKDMTPQGELELWEHITGVYLTVGNEARLDTVEKTQLFRLLLADIAFGKPEWPPDGPEWMLRAKALRRREIPVEADDYGSNPPLERDRAWHGHQSVPAQEDCSWRTIVGPDDR